MRVAVVQDGVVTSVLELDDAMVVAADRLSASGPATYQVEVVGQVTTHEYHAVFTPPNGALLVASSEANVGLTWSESTGFAAP
jgi:hypothetical protein